MKKYHVTLQPEEREGLLAFVEGSKNSSQKHRRALVLLFADEGKKDADIVALSGAGLRTVKSIRKRFAQEGFRASLDERPRPGRRRKLDAKGGDFLEMLVKSKPPEGFEHWTLKLLAGRLVELEVVNSISRDAVRDELLRRGIREW